MTIEATFTLHLTVHNVDDLFNAAWESCRKQDMPAVDIAKHLMIDGRIDIAQCICQLCDPGMSPPGTQIQDSGAEISQ